MHWTFCSSRFSYLMDARPSPTYISQIRVAMLSAGARSDNDTGADADADADLFGARLGLFSLLCCCWGSSRLSGAAPALVAVGCSMIKARSELSVTSANLHKQKACLHTDTQAGR